MFNVASALFFTHGQILSDQNIEKYSTGITYNGKATGIKNLLKRNKKEAKIGLLLLVTGPILQFSSQFL